MPGNTSAATSSFFNKAAASSNPLLRTVDRTSLFFM
jgi:hypothetical protein